MSNMKDWLTEYGVLVFCTACFALSSFAERKAIEEQNEVLMANALVAGRLCNLLLEDRQDIPDSLMLNAIEVRR